MSLKLNLGEIIPEKSEKISFIEVIFLFSPFLMGLFNAWVCAAVSVVLSGYLIWQLSKNKKFTVTVTPITVAVGAYALMSLLSVIWAVDSGMAIFGFIKFLPVLLYLAVLMQQPEKLKNLFRLLPLTAAIMTVVSSVLMQIDFFEKYFAIHDRLAGFMQYSNVCALYLLVAVIFTFSKQRLEIIDIIYLIINIFGIIYTGSRTVFVLTALSAIAIIIFHKNKAVKFSVLGVSVFGIAAIAVYAKISGKLEFLRRLTDLSLSDHSVIYRLIFTKDALPTILAHPFGIGYKGYKFILPAIQTGKYSVLYAHNDLTQMLLDVGFIPAIIFVVAIVFALFKKGTPWHKRLAIFVICAHCMFDFDMQFSFMPIILVSLCYYDGGKKFELNKTWAIKTLAAICAVVSVYFGIADFLFYAVGPDRTVNFYSYHTEANLKLLNVSNTPNQINYYADKILKTQSKNYNALYSKAVYYYSVGNFKSVIYYMDMAVNEAPLLESVYSEYAKLMIRGMELYKKSGDTESADVCYQKLKWVVDKWENIGDNVSYLGKKLPDQPDNTVPDEVKNAIKE